MPNTAAVQDLKKQLRGELLTSADPTYSDVRKVWNGMIDKRPALIVRCQDAFDVASAVNFARAEGMKLTVRGGGHNFAGKAVCDGGLMIDLALMKGIKVDAVQRTARAQTGLKLGEFDRATQQYGLMTPLGVATTTGISGLTLGGGYGWLVGTLGLSCDNVTAIEVVTADGKIIECSQEQNADLFWGMRGAGANFGVATRIDYRLHPLSTVYGGPLFQALTPEILRFYDEFSSNLPDDLTTMGVATKGPDGSPAFATVVCYSGSVSKGEKLVAPMRAFSPPLVDLIQQRPYLEMQSLFDADMAPGRRYYNKTHNLRRINNRVVDTVLRHVPTMAPYPSMIGFQKLHGAASRIAGDATAYPHRFDHHVVWLSPVVDDPAQDDQMVRWTHECWQALQPDADDAVYVNALDDAAEEGEARIKQAYGANFGRLQNLKRTYDPHNLFRQNSNIEPA